MDKEQNKNIDISGRVVSSEEMPKLDHCSGEMQTPEKDGSSVNASVSASMNAHGDDAAQEPVGVSERMINNTGGDKHNNQQSDADAATS